MRSDAVEVQRMSKRTPDAKRLEVRLICVGPVRSARALVDLGPLLSGRAPHDGVPAPVPFRTEHLLGVVVNWPSVA
jgi:hypothetical protein